MKNGYVTTSSRIQQNAGLNFKPNSILDQSQDIQQDTIPDILLAGQVPNDYIDFSVSFRVLNFVWNPIKTDIN